VNRLTEEHAIQNRIRTALSPTCAIFRTNSGDFWQGDRVYSNEYKQYVLINLRKIEGLPNGFSDLCGVRKSDGRAVFIEVKTPRGRVSENQKNFLKQMQQYGAIAGVCRSETDAFILLGIDYDR
jgi:hypothetical protein